MKVVLKVICFLICILSLKGQNSILDVRNEIIDYRDRGMYDSAIFSLEFYNLKASNPQQKADALYFKANLEFIFHNYPESISNYLTAISFAKKDSTTYYILPYCYDELGFIYQKTGEYEKALKAYIEGLQFSSKELKLRLSKSMASVYSKTKNYQKALLMDLNILKQLPTKPSELLASTYNRIGIDYYYMGSFRKALNFYKKAYRIAQKLKNRSYIGLYLHNIGDVYDNLLKIDSSIYYLEKSLMIRRTLSDDEDISQTAMNLARAYIKSDSLSKANNYLELAKEKIPKFALNLQREFLEIEIEYLESSKQYEKAFCSMHILMALKDSLLNQEKVKALTNMEIRYETKQKEEALEASLSREQIQRKSLTYQRYGLLSLAIIVVLLISLGFLLYRLFLQNKREKKAIQLRMREQHHRIENNISVLASILSLAAQNTTNREAQDIARDGEHRLNAMNLLHKKLYWDDEKITVSLDGYLKELINYLTGIHLTKEIQKVPVKISSEKVDIEVNRAIPLSLIANELLTNALKHGLSNPDPKVNISLKSTNGRLQLSISDNGAGFDAGKNEKQASFGMELVRSLVGQINGMFNFTSSKDGSTVQVEAPLK